MPKFLGNRIGYAATTYTDGGMFNSFAEQVFLRKKSKWPPAVTASGGSATLTPGNGYKYHIFQSTSTFTVTNGGEINYTIVAGGGGGGAGDSDIWDRGGGGGGAGGMRSGTIGIGVGDYTITIGAGGVYGDRNPGSQDARGAANGNPSSIVGAGIDLSTDGGGGGGSFLGPNIEFEASPGGSGGGTHGETAGSNIVGYGNNPTPYNISQGYPGGKKSAPFNPNYIGRQGGGGGGAGGAGGDSRKQVIYYQPNQPGMIQGCGGDGGTGRAFGVIQEDTFALPDAYGGEFGPNNKLYFAGGGGGGGGLISGTPYSTPISKIPTIYANNHGGSAGLGEGGRGGRYTPNTSNDRFGGFGGANSGGGGGGGAGGDRPSGYFDNRGGSGGSGIIIISYKETI